MSAAPPSAADLEAKSAILKEVEKLGGSFDNTSDKASCDAAGGEAFPGSGCWWSPGVRATNAALRACTPPWRGVGARVRATVDIATGYSYCIIKEGFEGRINCLKDNGDVVIQFDKMFCMPTVSSQDIEKLIILKPCSFYVSNGNDDLFSGEYKQCANCGFHQKKHENVSSSWPQVGHNASRSSEYSKKEDDGANCDAAPWEPGGAQCARSSWWDTCWNGWDDHRWAGKTAWANGWQSGWTWSESSGWSSDSRDSTFIGRKCSGKKQWSAEERAAREMLKNRFLHRGL